MSEAAKRTPGQVLREARRKDSDRKRSTVFRTVDTMQRDGIPITFASVARTAGVSNWLVYADGVREYIEKARKEQADEPARAERVGHIASDASLRTDLELARQYNRQLRDEVARLKQALRGRLGEQLEVSSSETLRQRVDQLTEACDRYRLENRQLQAELDRVRDQLRITEDELAAARTGIRRMIREHTADMAQ